MNQNQSIGEFSLRVIWSSFYWAPWYRDYHVHNMYIICTYSEEVVETTKNVNMLHLLSCYLKP